MYITLLWLAKVVQGATRLFGNSGAALPGLVVEKLSNNFLKHFLNKIPGGAIIISGTNGKTTTTKLVVEALESTGLKVLTNRSGSNMTRGLISAVISHASIIGRMPYDIAILEVDEAYAAKFAESIPVRGVVILNVMRDQLDRFGEIDKTAELLSSLTNSASGFVILNGDDSRAAEMAVPRGVKKVFFGLEKSIKNLIKNEDSWHGKSINKVVKLDFALISSANKSCSLELNSIKYDLDTQLIGVHNHLNVVAALACLIEIGGTKNVNEYIESIKKTKPAFGRGETIDVGNSSISLQLVKNPSSFMQTVSSNNLKNYDSVSIVLNDAYADGRDVSWLWDVDFSIFKSSKKIYTSGTRAYDLAVRLKYEDLSVSSIELDELKLAEKLIDASGGHVVFCSYTAMLRLRKLFVKKGHLEKVL